MELIGQGMEGAVYDLGDGTVRKIWFDRRPDDVRPLQAFLDELPPLPFRTPRIREIAADDHGQAISVEDKLTGTPMNEADLTEDQALTPSSRSSKPWAQPSPVPRVRRCPSSTSRSGKGPGASRWQPSYDDVPQPPARTWRRTSPASPTCWTASQPGWHRSGSTG